VTKSEFRVYFASNVRCKNLLISAMASRASGRTGAIKCHTCGIRGHICSSAWQRARCILSDLWVMRHGTKCFEDPSLLNASKLTRVGKD
jgi:hypothetical protein